MLTIWGRTSSFNVQKVLWLTGELGLAHRHIPAGGDFGLLDTPEFLAMNPHGRVPVIKDDEAVVWESHAILRYLAATYGRDRFWADGPARRAEAERWMDWSQTSLQPDFLNGVFWGFYRTPKPLRDMRAVAAKIADCGQHMRLLDRVLSDQPFLGGEAPNLADIPAGTVLYRYFGLDIDRPDVANVAAWYARLRKRPAYREHVMVPFQELEGRLEY
ncbi:glutathione S-transferase family protein [Rhodopila sp.]|uniref:glutathione S-transferase family protein n=1 Tax=Rhodopila sp. TaxID=2480087 RepID=UPI003D13D865